MPNSTRRDILILGAAATAGAALVPAAGRPAIAAGDDARLLRLYDQWLAVETDRRRVDTMHDEAWGRARKRGVEDPRVARLKVEFERLDDAVQAELADALGAEENG